MLSSYCYSFRGANFFARDADRIPLIARREGLVNSKVTRFIIIVSSSGTGMERSIVTFRENTSPSLNSLLFYSVVKPVPEHRTLYAEHYNPVHPITNEREDFAVVWFVCILRDAYEPAVFQDKFPSHVARIFRCLSSQGRRFIL